MSIGMLMECRLGFYLLSRSAEPSTEPANAACWTVIERRLGVMVRAAPEKTEQNIMQFPEITATAAAILMILQLFLMLSVGMYRAKAKVGTGYGNDQNLERLGRRHGNLAENAAIFLITLALLELRIGSTAVVFVLATTFVVARLAHAIGFSSLAGSHLSQGSKFFQLMRMLGAGLTAVSGFATAGYLLFSVISA